jgi:hypothetical protein
VENTTISHAALETEGAVEEPRV